MERQIVMAKFYGKEVAVPAVVEGDAKFGNSVYTVRQADALRSYGYVNTLNRLAVQDSQAAAQVDGVTEMMEYANRFPNADSRGRSRND